MRQPFLKTQQVTLFLVSYLACHHVVKYGYLHIKYLLNTVFMLVLIQYLYQ